jgi:hypothetical protein
MQREHHVVQFCPRLGSYGHAISLVGLLKLDAVDP